MFRHEADSIFGMNTRDLFIYNTEPINVPVGAQVWKVNGYLASTIKILNLSEVDINETPVIDIDEEKRKKIVEINSKYEEVISNIVKDTPNYERESWFKQEIEAKSWKDNQEAETPYINSLATSRGIDRELLISRILNNVEHYTHIHAYYTGIRQAKEDAIIALPADCSIEDILAINFIE